MNNQPVATPAAPVNVYIVEAEHWEVPGTIRAAFYDSTQAQAYAVTIAKMLRDDFVKSNDDYIPRVTLENWESCVEKINDALTYDSTACYVTVSELPVLAEATAVAGA